MDDFGDPLRQSGHPWSRARPLDIDRRVGAGALAVSAALWVLVTACYAWRPDSFAAVTVFPPWMWPMVGLWFSVPGWARPLRRKATLVALAWLAFLLVFAEEPYSLARGLWRSAFPPVAGRQATTIRVVAMSCDASQDLVADHIAPYRPDIVLLPESPAFTYAPRLARRIVGETGDYIWAAHAALMVRGQVLGVKTRPRRGTFFTLAHVRLHSGPELAIVSLRLQSAVHRGDIWSPDCWREHTANRRRRHRQLAQVIRRIADIPPDLPLIVGGDFNAPPGDAVLRPLRPRLRDAFKEAGLGWGNTILNEWPVLRIDQVWISRQLHALSVVARKTDGFQHRMVVADLVLQRRGD